ncbi:MAG: metallophosphoesterase [Armatimonadetes bacterium]|nr:metallophosphoesterase [Armatimonadota bacterium]
MKRVALIFLLTAILSFASVFSSVALAGHTIADALNALSLQRDPGPRWAFVVMADVRHFMPIVPSPVFERAVAEINVLRPDFAVIIGDLIFGYSDDRAQLKRMWDAYFEVVERCRVPLFPVVGNHDVSKPMHEELWRELVGPMYYAFRYGSALFLCLASDEAANPGMIGAEQEQWVAAQLEAHQDARQLFVFVHQPLFIGGPQTRWDAIHELLRRHPALTKVCFAGHHHVYNLLPERDGVRYVICGGGGSETGPLPEAGDFHHYLLVSVKGDAVHWAVIKTGAVEAEDAVTQEQAEVVRRMAAGIGSLQAVHPRQRDVVTLTLPITNETDSTIRAWLRWEGLAYCDKLDPLDVSVSVPPGEAKELVFSLAAGDPEKALANLTCLVTVLWGEGAKSFTVRRPVRKMQVGH